MDVFLKTYISDAIITFSGSLLDPDTLDIFSDVDITIALPENASTDVYDLIDALSKRFSSVFGYEIHNHDDSDTLRVCFENGWRFDITAIYSRERERERERARERARPPQTAENAYLDKIESIVNQFWFLASMVLVKLGRNDHLIAAHLALELCRLIIVVQMLERDEEKKTDIHRFGGGEDVPVIHSLVSGDKRPGAKADKTKNEILGILFHAAEHMDNIAAAHIPKYIKRSDILYELNNQFVFLY